MAKREFLQLAHVYEPAKHFVMGWYLSEKLDGIRAFWDGGISRGLACGEVPWANTRKHGRYLVAPKATGLWTRYCQPIQAPGWFLDKLPPILLDGELTMGRGSWESTSGCVRSLVPDSRWIEVKYKVFDSPPPTAIFADGSINNNSCKINMRGALRFWEDRQQEGEWVAPGGTPFYKTLAALRQRLDIDILEQNPVPHGSDSYIIDRLREIEAVGGEGLILKSPVSTWEPSRGKWMLKVKSMRDMEGTVVGYKWAKPTDLDKSVSGLVTNKLLGLMGSLRVQLPNGLEFDLSGFTDAERQMIGSGDPGEVADSSCSNPLFPRGSRITFKYRELSSDGLPKEGRYWRKL